MRNKTFLLGYFSDIRHVFVIILEPARHNQKLTFPEFIVIEKPQGKCFDNIHRNVLFEIVDS